MRNLRASVGLFKLEIHDQKKEIWLSWPSDDGEGACGSPQRRLRRGLVEVVTLRCTRLVRDRLHLPRQMALEPPASTGRLGDWYIHLVRFGRPEFVIATSERSLLTVLFPARGLRTTLTPNLRGAVGSLLESLAVPREAVAREIAAMESVSFGTATNRRVLGSMNEFAFLASVQLAHGDDLLTLSRRLAETPMSAIGAKSGGYGYPGKLAHEFLATNVG